jgi:hypothetical protein
MGTQAIELLFDPLDARLLVLSDDGNGTGKEGAGGKVMDFNSTSPGVCTWVKIYRGCDKDVHA